MDCNYQPRYVACWGWQAEWHARVAFHVPNVAGANVWSWEWPRSALETLSQTVRREFSPRMGLHELMDKQQPCDTWTPAPLMDA